MIHKRSSIARLILFMLLLYLPILACSSLSGGDEDGGAVITTGEAERADADDDQEDAAGDDETSGDPAGSDGSDTLSSDSGDAPSSDSIEGEEGDNGDSDSIDRDAAENDPADSDPADSDPAENDPADSDPADSDPAENDPADSDPADSDDDPDSAPTVGPSPDGWGASGSGPQSACDHPYLPLRTGSSWTYENGPDTLVWDVTEVVGGLDSATAVLRITVGDTSIDYFWSCESGTGLASFDFANINSAAAGFEMTLVQLSADGQFLLPADQLLPGATWDTTLESAISFSMEEGGGQLEVLGNMVTVQTNQVINNDPVTFDDQTVDGILVEQTDDIRMALTILENVVNQNLTLNNSTNFGRGIGMITQASASDFGTETSQLVSYFIP